MPLWTSQSGLYDATEAEIPLPFSMQKSILLTVGSQKWLKIAPPTQPNMEFSWIFQQWIGKLKMPLTMGPTSGLLNCNSQTKGWCHYDSIIESHYSSLIPCTLWQIASFVAGGWKQKSWKQEQCVIFQSNSINSLLCTCRPCCAWQK